MKPLSISLRNVRTYDSLDLDLPEGAVAVVGTNGAGKSTVVNAIDVALFGPESRTLADWLSEDQPDGTLSITLTFEHDGDTYRTRRTHSKRGPKFDFEQLVSGYKIITEQGEANGDDLAFAHWEPLTRESMAATQAALEDLVGLNRATFRASSFIAAGVMFCDLQPREQKRILGELLQLGQWDAWRDRAAAERRATESELDRVAGSLERAEQELAGRPEIENELGLAQERAKETKGLLDAAVAALATAREALAEERVKGERRAGAEKAVQDAEAAVSTLKAQIEGREIAVRQYDERLADREGLEVLAEGLPGLERERDRLTEQAQEYAERERLERDWKRLNDEAKALDAKAADLHAKALAVRNGADTECDRCGSRLTNETLVRAAASYEAESAMLAEQVTPLDDEASVLLVKIAALPKEPPDSERAAHVHDLIQQGQHAKQRLAELGEVARHREQALVELEEMRAGLPEREQGLTAARSALEALGPHDPDEADRIVLRVRDLEGEETKQRALYDEQARWFARSQERLDRLDQIALETRNARALRETLQADRDLYVRMEKACGPNGVPALILEQIAIPQIETAADEILRRFGSKAIGVQLLTQREKKDGGLADTLQVNVLTEYGSRDYKTFSTGERLRINAAITLAIAQLVAARSAQTGLLVIDDLGPLDSQGMAVLAEICQELQATVGRVYVISQSPELRDAFETSIEIQQVDGHSRIVSEQPAMLVQAHAPA